MIDNVIPTDPRPILAPGLTAPQSECALAPTGAAVRPNLVALVALLISSPAAAQVAGSLQQPIIGGDAIASDVFPSAAQLIIGGTVNGQPIKSPVCTATLVAPDVVLTAGHCLEEFPITFGIFEMTDLTFWVTFEEDLGSMTDEQHGGDPPLPDDAVEAAGFLQHPDFAFESFQGGVDGPGKFDDIALVFLDRAITDRAHAWLPTAAEDASIAEQQTVDIVGYGQQTPAAADPFQPPAPGTVYVRMHAETFINELAEFEMQIGDGEETGRKCHGDSGGPTYAQVDTDLGDDVRVVGVTSHAYDDRDCLVGGVDTRVGPYLEWIADVFAEACADGIRVDCEEPGIPRPESEGEGGGGACAAGCSQSDPSPSGAVALVGLALLGRRRRT